MTTSSTISPAAAAILSRPSRPRLGLPHLVWALAATQFVGRAGGVVRSFLVLYLTQEQHLSPAPAGAVIAAVGVGDIGSQLLRGWLGDRMLGPLAGTALLDLAGPTVLGSASAVSGIALFAAQRALAPALHRRTAAHAAYFATAR